VVYIYYKGSGGGDLSSSSPPEYASELKKYFHGVTEQNVLS